MSRSVDMELIFYTTEACRLCELAESVLVNTPLATPVAVEVVDISESAALVERYGMRIPVLQRSDDGQELNWPFTPEDIQRFAGHRPAQERKPC